ncbi:hypothetical protein [Bacillus sp. KH172YL63]|uniref:hypothetical protein n=1 Tax=Bacillus sp. KH172YL63 TaxID=2709784 RepID=UPI0013E41C60|nr:hypothetical protein [Bacillus sp. KH172YL63]BCB03613.1 hypothetical protein KH172YL63_17460 [Bacillus sp. KH172YL63]
MGLRAERYDYEHEKKKEPAKQLKMYTFLRILGLCIFTGWGIMIFTVPLDLNDDLEWVIVKGVHLDREKIIKFFLCWGTVGVLYYALLYAHFVMAWSRKAVLTTLMSLGVLDVVLFFLSL